MSDTKEVKENKGRQSNEPRVRFKRRQTSIDEMAAGNLKFTGGDPNYHYHWVLDGDPDKIGNFQSKYNLGYDPVPVGEVEHYASAETPSVEGSVIAVPAKGGSQAKLVLCKIPKELREKHLRDLRRKANAVMEAEKKKEGAASSTLEISTAYEVVKSEDIQSKK